MDGTSCCQKCGDETTCDSIFPGSDLNTIKTCVIHGMVVPTKELLVEQQLDGDNKSFSSSVMVSILLSGTVVVGVLAYVVMQTRKRKEGSDESSLSYQLLM